MISPDLLWPYIQRISCEEFHNICFTAVNRIWREWNVESCAIPLWIGKSYFIFYASSYKTTQSKSIRHITFEVKFLLTLIYFPLVATPQLHQWYNTLRYHWLMVRTPISILTFKEVVLWCLGIIELKAIMSYLFYFIKFIRSFVSFDNYIFFYDRCIYFP